MKNVYKLQTKSWTINFGISTVLFGVRTVCDPWTKAVFDVVVEVVVVKVCFSSFCAL